VKSNNKKRQRKKIVYTLQIVWIVSAIIATIILLVAGNRLLGIDKAGEAMNQGMVSANESEETVPKEEAENPVQDQNKENEKPNAEEQKEEDGTVQENDGEKSEGGTPSKGESATDQTEEGADSKEGAEEPVVTPQEGQTEGTPAAEDDKTSDQELAADLKAQEVIAKNNIDVSKPMVALTFDDGPYPKVTNRILQVLSDNGGRATFFVMGNRMDSYGDTVEKAYEQGNQIGNHTYSHKDLTKITIKELQYEVGYACELIQEHAAEEQVVLRPPYGSRNDTVSENLTVPMIAWSLDTEDWKSRDAKSVINNVLGTVKDGDIILMHDLYESTAEAVEYLVPELIKRGYQLVTIDELFAAKGHALEAGKVYYNGR